MKAIICTKYGPSDVLQLSELKIPIPKSNELLIRVFATTVTSGDIPRRQGKPLISRLFTGLRKPNRNMNVLGSEFAGDVTEVGSLVRKFKPGDQVFGLTGWKLGAYAEYLSLPEDGLITHKPKHMTLSMTQLEQLHSANVKNY